MFCKYCGKEIADNDVCYCEGAVNERLNNDKNITNTTPTQEPMQQPEKEVRQVTFTVNKDNVWVNALIDLPHRRQLKKKSYLK